MKIKTPFFSAAAMAVLLILTISAAAQKAAPKPSVQVQKPIIFAVLNDGRTLEPIGFLGKKMTPPVNGSDEEAKIAAFDKLYYHKGSKYKVVFGGINAGTVAVDKFDAAAECSRNMAEVTATGLKTPLKGMVMGLATNAAIKATNSYRRKPTTVEKAELDRLATAEFRKQKISPKTLRYQNITAIDVDNDGAPEFVASYWVEVDKQKRGLLFFIAQKGGGGKYFADAQTFRMVDKSQVMSGDIKNVDDGVYHELLLDSFDTDGDGVNEIFTYTQSFEGAGFDVYTRSGGKWTRSYDFSNYHCGY